MRHFCTLAITIFFIAAMQAQNTCDVISLTPIYPCVDTMKNIQYGQGKRDFGFPDVANGCAPFDPLFTDIFRPCTGNTAPRPLIIFIHGGSFISGNKKDFWKQCDEFARRGYVTATLQYRLSLNFLNINRKEIIRAGYRAQQDAKAAVRFFKAHADEYSIDTSNIFMLGYSAGAVTALNVIYARDEDERPAEVNEDAGCGNWMGCPYCPDLGPLEGEGGNPGFSSKVKAVYSMAGAVMDLSMMDEYDDAPISMIHGTNDATVDYDSACFLNLVPCPKVYGSNSMLYRAEELGICASLHTLPGAGHDLSAYQNTILEEASAFFYKNVCENDPCSTTGVEIATASLPIKASPNPAGDWLKVEIPNGESGELMLADMTGKSLQREVFSTGKKEIMLSMEGLPQGIYFLFYKNSAMNRRQALKIFKT